MNYIPPAEISGKIMTLIDQANSKLVLVSPFNKIKRWDKLNNRISKALERGVNIHWYVRSGVKDNDLDHIKSLGIEPVEVDNLHAKFYMNENHAVVTSMNLHIYSDSSSIDIGYWVNERSKMEELKRFISTYLPSENDPNFYALLKKHLQKYNPYYQSISESVGRYGKLIRLEGFLDHFDLIFEPKGSYFRMDLRTLGNREQRKKLYFFVHGHHQTLEEMTDLSIQMGIQWLRFKIDLTLHESYDYEQWGEKEFEILQAPLDQWISACLKVLDGNIPE